LELVELPVALALVVTLAAVVQFLALLHQQAAENLET
jgi:hypothetical protein